MSPKQKMITALWCAVTMIATTVLSHGHLIMREIVQNWPTSDSWEGRFETALYTQGGLMFLASVVLAGATIVRAAINKSKDEQTARRDRSQREQHERAAAMRHDAMMEQLASLSPRGEECSTGATAKKVNASGARPR